MIMDAMFYEQCDNKIKCKLCPHNCVILEDKCGICSTKMNKAGKLKALNYGEVTSLAEDPIEKKPLYHFKPGKHILSVGSFGCNFSCSFCQNYTISQQKAKSEFISPEELTAICNRLENNTGIAFTYNEPSIWYEYVYDTAKLLKSKSPDKSVVLVTNGYIEKAPLKQLLPYVDAMNIDLKAFTDKYYKNLCGGKLQPVLDSIETASKECHIEITTLLVNGENDSEEEVEKIASFLEGINKNIPLHLSRYFPNYKLENPPTKVEKMMKDWQIAKKYLNYVYWGNLSGVDNSTYCPQCGELLISRSGYYTDVKISEPKCPKCGYDINIVL